MKLNRILEYYWPQPPFGDALWEIRYDKDGKLYISEWDEKLTGREKPTDTELERLGEEAEATLAKEARISTAKRLLFETDWRMTVDKAETMDAEALTAWKEYRTKLREVVNEERSEIPDAPTF